MKTTLVFFLLFTLVHCACAQNDCKLVESVDKFNKEFSYSNATIVIQENKKLKFEVTSDITNKRLVIGFLLGEKETVKCLESITVMKLLFDDGSIINLLQMKDFNCDGIAITMIGRPEKSKKKNPDDVFYQLYKKLETNNISAIRIPTKDGSFDIDFLKEDALNIEKDIICAMNLISQKP